MCDVARERGTRLQNLGDVVKLLQDRSLRSILHRAEDLLRIVLTAPATSCAAERTFSQLRRIKNWLRSTLGQERLNHAIMMAVHRDRLEKLNMRRRPRSSPLKAPSAPTPLVAGRTFTSRRLPATTSTLCFTAPAILPVGGHRSWALRAAQTLLARRRQSLPVSPYCALSARQPAQSAYPPSLLGFCGVWLPIPTGGPLTCGGL